MRADKIKTRACAGTPAHLHAYDPTEQDAWIQIHCLYALGGVSSEKPHAYLLRVACCSVCMAACRVAVHLTTVDVCAIRTSRKILSCGFPAAVRYALKLARIMPFCPFPSCIPSQTEGGGQQLKMPCLLCLVFYDALSHHAYVFLLVSVNLETDLPTQEEMPAQEEMPCTKRCQRNKEWQRKRRRQHKITLLNEN